MCTDDRRSAALDREESMMARGALALYGVWLGLAFGLRTVVQLRRTGDSGWRGVSGRFGSAEWFAGVLFVFALIIGVAGPILGLAGLRPLIDASEVHVVGAVLTVAGVVLTLAAQFSMRESWRIGVDASEATELRTSGAFAIVRNPIFSAMVVTAVGLGLMVPNIVSAVGVVMLVVAVQLQVRVVEEPYLRGLHGRAYSEYEAQVGRFVPRLSRLRGHVGHVPTLPDRDLL